VHETKTILTNLLKHELVIPETQPEILKWYDIITGQNYFTHNKDIILHYDGLAMGAPSSGIIAEKFLQHIEYTHLPHLACKHKIINYCRYVDDVSLIFDSTHTSIREIHKDFNELHQKLQLHETKTILTNLLKHELVIPQTQPEILKWYDVITGQN